MYTIDEMRNPSQYRCSRCHSNFTKKEFDDHMEVCKVISLLRNDRSIDSYFSQMDIPSQKAQFRYIVQLTKKIEELEQKLTKIQKTIIPLCRRQVGEYLESLPAPEYTYSEWCQSIQISDEALEQVIKTDLKTGIKMVLENMIEDIPIRAFTQKTNILYLYDNDEWRTMTTPEFVKLIEKIQHKFLRKYMLWVNDHHDELAGEDRAIFTMAKVNGVKQGTLESRSSDIKKWLFSKIAVSLKQVVI